MYKTGSLRALSGTVVLTFALASLCVFAPGVRAETGEDEEMQSELFDLTLEELLDMKLDEEDERGLLLYGFLRANVERVYKVPFVDSDGDTDRRNDPLEWSFPGIHLYGTARPFRQLDVLFNLEGDEDGVAVREAYGNYKVRDEIQFRAGPMYRRFGLFNEKLDQFPTFLGIEPPELFDKDHLLLDRTNLVAVHGERDLGDYLLLYRFDSGNGEAGAEKDVYPLGWDLRVKGKSFIAGTSGFSSSIANGGTSPTVSVGDGSPRGGVMPWMDHDNYIVFGGFVEYTWKRLLLQGAYWQAHHNASRDPASVLTVVTEAGINSRQRRRFLGSNASKPDAALTTADVKTRADYNVRTFYLRAGYTIPSEWGSFTPYVFVDWMDHPEAIASKTYGGDNESGFADNGKFWKPSVGLVYKPVDALAVKLDSSMHVQKFNGSTKAYPEVRLDISYSFKMFGG
jgi:hypothetical protein